MTFIEKALLPLFRRHPALHEFLWFGMKQAWACLFGALLLAGILVTRLWYPDIPLARYDFLVFYAVGIQFALILLKFESWRELCVIFLFHLMATAWYLLMQLSFILIYALRRLEEKLGMQGPEKIIPGKQM